ncbi:hypothetical protein [Streptomyces sp. RFCAC02]|uniref:hypothetical protein n=1 Tax=Streptomyces sp. RFCAC02 TaxID=2499143 RepID=UPI001F100B33|nr:hypothetical protein [Streptomyces sp. RFCAC02]
METTTNPTGQRTTSWGRAARTLAAPLLAATALLAGSVPAAADDGDAPTEAGTTFRTATVIDQGQTATATASTGDYLYWVFPAAAGQTATAEATITFPEAAARTGTATWRLDVYDGLRRRQACTEGPETAAAAEDTGTVSLSCTLRTVRPWAEPWSDAPLPGGYYVRVTVADLPERDLGQPFDIEVTATVADEGGSAAAGGDLATPLLPVGSAGAPAEDGAAAGDDGDDGGDGTSGPYLAALPEPDGGWNGGWWTDRWLWTAAGGVLAALAGVGGYRIVRGPRAPRGA